MTSARELHCFNRLPLVMPLFCGVFPCPSWLRDIFSLRRGGFLDTCAVVSWWSSSKDFPCSFVSFSPSGTQSDSTDEVEVLIRSLNFSGLRLVFVSLVVDFAERIWPNLGETGSNSRAGLFTDCPTSSNILSRMSSTTVWFGSGGRAFMRRHWLSSSCRCTCCSGQSSELFSDIERSIVDSSALKPMVLIRKAAKFLRCRLWYALLSRATRSKRSRVNCLLACPWSSTSVFSSSVVGANGDFANLSKEDNNDEKSSKFESRLYLSLLETTPRLSLSSVPAAR